MDSNSLHADSWRRAFEQFGIEVGLDEAWSQIGKGGDQLIPVFVKQHDLSDWTLGIDLRPQYIPAAPRENARVIQTSRNAKAGAIPPTHTANHL